MHSLSPFPQADTKVPNETEHKHSKVAVTQSRLVWEHRELRALPPHQSSQKPASKRSNRVPWHPPPNSNGENPNAPPEKQACSGDQRHQAHPSGGCGWQVERVHFPPDPSTTSLISQWARASVANKWLLFNSLPMLSHHHQSYQ